MAGTRKTSNVVDLRPEIKTLLDDKLLTIIETDDYAHLDGEFKDYLCLPEQLFKDSPFKFYDRALERSIEGSSAPLDGLFYLTCVVTLVGDIALVLTTSAFGLTIINGLYNYYTNKKHSLEKRQNHIHDFQLGDLRLLAAKIYVERMQERIREIQTEISDVVAESKPVSDTKDVVAESKPVSNTKSVCLKVIASLFKGANTGTAIILGYYLTAIWLFEAIQLATISAAMLTPVGLGIAIGIALCAGIYCGYRHYKTMQANELVAHRKKVLSEEVHAKREEVRVKGEECARLSGFRDGLFYAKNQNSEMTGKTESQKYKVGKAS
jgi:hypothetical protein